MKPVPDMTYNVFGGTLNLAQFNISQYSTMFAVRNCYDAYNFPFSNLEFSI